MNRDIVHSKILDRNIIDSIATFAYSTFPEGCKTSNRCQTDSSQLPTFAPPPSGVLANKSQLLLCISLCPCSILGQSKSKKIYFNGNSYGSYLLLNTRLFPPSTTVPGPISGTPHSSQKHLMYLLYPCPILGRMAN